MTKAEILEQIKRANEAVQQWPEWEKNILEHSLQPTNSVARTPVDNRVDCVPPPVASVPHNTNVKSNAE